MPFTRVKFQPKNIIIKREFYLLEQDLFGSVSMETYLQEIKAKRFCLKDYGWKAPTKIKFTRELEFFVNIQSTTHFDAKIIIIYVLTVLIQDIFNS